MRLRAEEVEAAIVLPEGGETDDGEDMAITQTGIEETSIIRVAERVVQVLQWPRGAVVKLLQHVEEARAVFHEADSEGGPQGKRTVTSLFPNGFAEDKRQVEVAPCEFIVEDFLELVEAECGGKVEAALAELHDEAAAPGIGGGAVAS